MASIWTQPFMGTSKPRLSSNFMQISVLSHTQLKFNPSLINPLRAIADSDSLNSSEHHQVPLSLHHTDSPFNKLQSAISTLPPVVFLTRRQAGSNIVIWLCIAAAFLVISLRVFVARNSRHSRPPGSVADLVRRGQLRSDRRGISRPLKYDDPFNNPLVKISKSNSTVEMCGKVYRLAPVTLTKEEQAIHKKRRSRAYQWKRPTIFLKEGDSIPPDVDPETVRWIPTNHPFATTASDIDEDLAQTNVYQKHGVPFRIRAEHEALQKKLEALQQDQKLNKLVIDTGNVKDYERPFKSNSKSNEIPERTTFNNQAAESKHSNKDSSPNSLNSSSSPEETKK
ncbi:protein MULTIPLE CHLOROPLAST DIVISION SITE 1 [Mercurialis annua]|uniref:protein MULTIPLE CHLOROPLAST DIVISION SITE 1 n=1 Tax=Mercurialis annua TaxID=3986 RepID=UPI00215EDF34|nr:protein MULTIPLE CHLOROPLAST DIVISION SITE 1 [Mercurialis annua]